MDIPDSLLCMFSAEIEATDELYRIEIPARELELGDVELGERYRVAVLDSPSENRQPTDQLEIQTEQDPPITEGDRRTVDIVNIGEQGDGIARVERGYVVIVPETERGDRVRIDIKHVQETLAFGEVIDHVEPAVHE